ncbi:MAG TPA: PLP-dependent aminotransferase family protein [Rhodopila sp.]|jgi:GntR family transcriptional regulator/MocR family aminotransferase|nr:PLP-dependent aminotransferase family protein [Rhodopila sp.]
MGLSLIIEKTAETDLFRQIADAIRNAIAAGQVVPGARLPSARALSEQLCVGRGTVDAAYAMLAGEGAIVSRRGSGTVVSGNIGARLVSTEATPFMFAPDITVPNRLPVALRPRLPALDAFPIAIWSRLVAEAAREISPAELADPDPAGLLALRAAIAAWLTTHRGVACSAANVVVTAGFQGALALTRGVLLGRGDAVWVEDPGHPSIRQALEAAGARVVPVRIDDDGMRVASGIAAAPKAKLAVVTPPHQYPNGMALSLPRRLELLAWASEVEAWVLEDDTDSVFRLNGRPLQPLKSLDRGRRVIQAGSFSQTLFPALRLGYLVVPNELCDAFERAARLLTLGQPSLEQRALAAFLAKGHFIRHLSKMRRLYTERRTALTVALRETFGEEVLSQMPPGGLHLIARLADAVDDTVLAKRALTAGLAPCALSSLSAAHGNGQGLLLAYSNIPANRAGETVGKLKRAIETM